MNRTYTSVLYKSNEKYICQTYTNKGKKKKKRSLSMIYCNNYTLVVYISFFFIQQALELRILPLKFPFTNDNAGDVHFIIKARTYNLSTTFGIKSHLHSHTHTYIAISIIHITYGKISIYI